MNESPYIFEVNQSNFATVVVENSQQVPVLVDFWADWCQPCRTLTPLLSKLVQEYRGGVILAKINADDEQALAQHFRVRSLPTVMIVWQGQIVDQMVGVQPESAYREAIARLQAAPPPGDPIMERVELLWERGRQEQAVELLRQALLKEATNVEWTVNLADKLLQLGQGDEARTLLQGLPEDERAKQPASGLLARLRFADLAQGSPELATLEATVRNDPTDLAARRQLAARYVLAGDYEAALEQFMDIMRRNPGFEDEAGRKGLIAIFEVLGNEDPLVSTYRRRMFSLLH
ncbi:MAG TPA: thioredoxin [Candidatus Competibacteraceae bacterium]|nr:thioredoxin [Candidatus Competibacteraceae bacterium]HQA26104.1 thioredoxin [Candidatus Competibacteraceae bacterium]HQD56992.1 thioredoxin [Candidatus Competibacteraceae bacterium]